MRQSRTRLSAILLMGLGLAGLQAQNMYVKESAGTQTVYALDDISKVSFSSGNLNITMNNRSSNAYSLNGLRYLSFRNISIGVKRAEIGDVQAKGAHHRRVGNVLSIHLTDAGVQDRTIDILNLRGQLVKRQRVARTGLVSIDVRQLARGIYVCRYDNYTEANAIRFIKE